MKNIHIENSYNIWSASTMYSIITERCLKYFNSHAPEIVLNRTYASIYIEWWLHNIGYYLTKPLCSINFFKQINLRCKDVDINEWIVR